jgi:integrase
MRKPYFRTQTGSWYVEHRGKQYPLGKETRTLVGRPKEPPPHVIKAYHELMAGQKSPKDMTLDDAINAYEKSLGEWNEKNRVQTLRTLRKFARVNLGKVSKLLPIHLTEYLRTQRWSDNTKWLFCSRLLSCLGYCVREGLLSSNPLAGYRKPTQKRRTRVMSQDEQKTLEAAAYPELRDVLIALRLSGCRPNEICTLTIDRCDLERGTIRVLDKNRKKTGNTYRTVFLPEELIALIRSKIGTRDGHVFLNKAKRPFSSDGVQKRVLIIRKRLGLSDGVYPYACRHRYASDAINDASINPALVARQFGHADLNQLMRTYLHEGDDAMKRMAEQATKKPTSE